MSVSKGTRQHDTYAVPVLLGRTKQFPCCKVRVRIYVVVAYGIFHQIFRRRDVTIGKRFVQKLKISLFDYG